MRRLKRRISRRQFSDWAQFHKLHPVDGDRQRDSLLALAVVYLARAAGDQELQVDDLLPDPFEATPADDMATIIGAFQASG